MTADTDAGIRAMEAGRDATGIARGRRTLLVIVALSVCAFYALFAYRTFVLHYYPSPPFIYDEGDTLADWLNTCAWSDRSDRYTAWQSLYTPFAHIVCTISNIILGPVHPKWYGGWRQYSPIARSILLINVFLWLTIFWPIKPFPPIYTPLQKLRIYLVQRFPFKLLTFLSYGALYSFERGHLLSISYFIFLLSFRISYQPACRLALQPMLVGIAAAIKPYILLFTLYGRRWLSVVVALVTVVLLQVIPVLIVGAPGIENLPANLDYFAKDNKMMDVVAKAVNSISFRSYLDMKKLAVYGIGMGIKGLNFLMALDALFIVSCILFVILAVLCLRCFLTALRLDNSSIKARRYEFGQTEAIAKEITRENYHLNARTVLLRYAIPSSIFVLVFMMYSQSSGAYVVLFLLVPLLCIEEETFLITRSPLLLLLYFFSICAFDMPWLSAKSYECGVSFPLDDFRQIPLLTELTGEAFTCMGTFVGPVSLARPLLVLVFGCLLMVKLRHYIVKNYQPSLSSEKEI